MEEFSVTDEQRELWAVELDLLAKFKEVCKKHRLKYYASGGTLLGAVRHQGFIPWDDDIDLQMPWSDYKKLMEIADSEFSYPYYFQCYRTGPFSGLSNNKLRRSDTTGCTQWEFDNIKSPNHNRGIFIDVFPLFSVPENLELRKAQKTIIVETWKAMRGWSAVQNRNAGYPSEYEQYIPDYENMAKEYSIAQIKQTYINACAMAEGETEEIGETSFRTHNEKFIWKRAWFSQTIELPFEDTTIACPYMYDEVLTKQYGDWRTPVYNAAMHEMMVFDVNTPYFEKTNLF